MASASQGHFDAYEALDLTEFAKKQPWWRKLFGQESRSAGEKYSVATQLLIGGVTGWCTGFIFQKVGKLAATAVGGGFFLLQLANHTGYIKVDWSRVEKDMKKAKEQLTETEEEECFSNWRIFWRLSARYGILRVSLHFHCSPASTLHRRKLQTLLPLQALLSVVNLNRFHRHLAHANLHRLSHGLDKQSGKHVFHLEANKNGPFPVCKICPKTCFKIGP